MFLRQPRFLRYVLVSLAAVLVLAGVGVWWYRVTRPDHLLRRAQDALRQGDRDQAEALLLRLEEAGHKEHACLLSADLLARTRQYDRALRELAQMGDGTEIGLRVQAADLAGWCLLHLGNMGDAARHLSFVLEHQPNHLRAHQGLADIFYHLGALGQAATHFEAAARLDPNDGRPCQFLGYIHKDLDQKDEAIQAYQEALRRDLAPKAAAGVRQELAELLVSRGGYAEAEQVLDACDPRAAEEPVLLALRAECLWGLGRREEARALLDRVLPSHPQSGELLRGRAKMHLAADEFAAAAALLERAVALDRHDLVGRHHLAQAYEALGRRADAAEQRRLHEQTTNHLDELTRLNREATQNPWDAAVRRRLAELCQQLGKTDLAAMWLEAAGACRSPRAAGATGGGRP